MLRLVVFLEEVIPRIEIDQIQILAELFELRLGELLKNIDFRQKLHLLSVDLVDNLLFSRNWNSRQQTGFTFCDQLERVWLDTFLNLSRCLLRVMQDFSCLQYFNIDQVSRLCQDIFLQFTVEHEYDILVQLLPRARITERTREYHLISLENLQPGVHERELFSLDLRSLAPK